MRSIFQKERWMGIVHCGKSHSKEVDIGLLKIEDAYCAEHCAKILSKVTSSVVLSVGEDQFPKYKELFQQAEIILDSNKVGGFFTGILSVFSAFRIFQFFVLRADMVYMNPELFIYLQNEFKKDPNHDFYIFQSRDEIFYSCGIYTKQGLEKLYNLHNKGNLNFRKPDAILQYFDTKYFPIEDSWNFFFKSICKKNNYEFHISSIES